MRITPLPYNRTNSSPWDQMMHSPLLTFPTPFTPPSEAEEEEEGSVGEDKRFTSSIFRTKYNKLRGNYSWGRFAAKDNASGGKFLLLLRVFFYCFLRSGRMQITCR